MAMAEHPNLGRVRHTYKASTAWVTFVVTTSLFVTYARSIFG